MQHLKIRANGATFHVARTGAGPALLLLHGWPEFWLTWEPVMARLADRHTLFAPDLRGFGDSDKPDGPFGPDQHAADMLALMDALELKQAGIVGHDVAGALMQPLARTSPQRISGLFFFDFVYPGIGPRMAEPERLNNIWYQSFNQMEMAPGPGRRDARKLPDLYRTLSESLGAPQGCLRRRPRNLHRQFPQARQPRRRLCALPRFPSGADPDDEGRGAAARADQGADLHPLGGARPAVSLCLDRPARRDLLQPRSRAVSRRRDTFRTARTPNAPPRRSARSMGASAGAKKLKERWDRQTR